MLVLVWVLIPILAGVRRHRRHRSSISRTREPVSLELETLDPSEENPPTIPEDDSLDNQNDEYQGDDFDDPSVVEYTEVSDEDDETPDFDLFKSYLIRRIAPPYVSANSLKRKIRVHVEPMTIGEHEQLYAKFGSEIVSCTRKNASMIKCHAPASDAGKLFVAISGDRVHWSDPFPLYYLDGWFFEQRELAIYGCVLCAIVCIALWLVFTCCGKPRRSKKPAELFQFDLSDDEN